jgi:hypothetical protein
MLFDTPIRVADRGWMLIHLNSFSAHEPPSQAANEQSARFQPQIYTGSIYVKVEVLDADTKFSSSVDYSIRSARRFRAR